MGPIVWFAQTLISARTGLDSSIIATVTAVAIILGTYCR